MNNNIKDKIIAIITIIIVFAIFFIALAIKENHQNQYAEEHNCTWTVQGSHDICK